MCRLEVSSFRLYASYARVTLLVERFDVRRQEAPQSEVASLVLGERRALVHERQVRTSVPAARAPRVAGQVLRASRC